MKTIPFLIPLTVVLAANGVGNLSFAVPQNWILHIRQWWFTSTGIFRINQLQDSTGVNYTNATQSVPIPSTFLQNPGNAFLSINTFLHDIDLDGGKSIIIQVQDTSVAGNTINAVLNCMVDYNQ